ncbi:XdhC family protein [Pontibacter actiniarum]|uniref:Alanine dehydrogenase n=1 Tax=Pontibacter actiniarum TaxID=323450 RepID=A0A1X9YSG5_9BACT|nr:XdhC/CoxI family protein [Pontibacter actiniarum]ARS35836.1 alanine dehydrogenase [Pontibacter actiniarum]
MKELQDIVRAYDVAQQQGKQTALATVVHVAGSSYRRPGARMLVTEDGQLTGAISGGCLEGDALRKARLAMLQQKPLLVTYDTTDEDDATLGVGLGCNGIIQVLLEPLDTADAANPISFLKAFLGQRQAAVLVTLFSLERRTAAQPGTCLFIPESGEVKGACTDEELQKALLGDAEEVLLKQESLTKAYAATVGTLTGFVELLQPAVSLVVFGAGNDAVPLTQLASILGWQVTVVDGRANYARRERFPAAQRVLVAKPEEALAQLVPDQQTVCLLMTHNYNYDLAMLRQLLPLKLPYVGSLGPRKKLERMLRELKEEGAQVPEQALESVYGPTGLDIGAETPEEIALSIVAEIKAVLARKSGTFLRSKPGTIHPRAAQQVAAAREHTKYSGCSLSSL